LLLHCRVRIVRVEESSAGFGVGGQIEEFAAISGHQTSTTELDAILDRGTCHNADRMCLSSDALLDFLSQFFWFVASFWDLGSVPKTPFHFGHNTPGEAHRAL